MRTHLGLLLIAAVCAASARAEPTFVGIWYSANQPSLIESKYGGTVHEEFSKCENGTVAGYHSVAKFEFDCPSGV